MKKPLIQKLGLLGIVSFLSYTAAVVFAPLAYPGYNRMAQAVSDLSAANAPSLALWNQLSALYNACEVVCVTVVCICNTHLNHTQENGCDSSGFLCVFYVTGCPEKVIVIFFRATFDEDVTVTYQVQ